MTDCDEQGSYDIGVRLAQANPGIDYDDLLVTETSNRETWDLIQFIDEEERDSLAIYLENGFLDEREGTVHKVYLGPVKRRW